MIPLSEPELDGNEARYLQECVESGFVSSVGAFVNGFEEQFGQLVGSRDAVACASGTSALHLSLVALGVGPGDVVAVSDLTFIASANAISYTGATPLLVDSEGATWNLDGELLHDEVTKRARSGGQLPRAIEVVHLLGHPADVDPLLALGEEYGIPIIEDAAESLGATMTATGFADRHVGTIGDLGCYSFNGNKMITTGGGGMVVGDEGLLQRVRHLSTQARLPGHHYVHDDVGFNYRMTNVAAALGLAQLERLHDFLERRRRISATYRSSLDGLVTMCPSAPWADPSCWLSSILLETTEQRDAVMSALRADGIDARPIWTPMHRQPPYLSSPLLSRTATRTVADRIADTGLSLPSSASLTDLQQQFVIDRLLVHIGATK